MTFKSLVYPTFAFVLATTASAYAQPLPQASAQNFEAQFDQVAEALIATSGITQDGVHYYQGRDRQGQACLVTVQYGAKDLEVEVKSLGAGVSYEESVNVNVPAKSRDVTSIEVNSNTATLGVEIQQEVTPYHSTQVDHYSYSLHADLNSSEAGIGRLAAIRAHRNDKGKVLDKECGSLRPVLAIEQSDVNGLDEQARNEYLRRNGADSAGPSQGMEVQSCVINSATSITCDVSLATDYTPDTLHVTYSIKKGKLGAIQALDFEPGC